MPRQFDHSWASPQLTGPDEFNSLDLFGLEDVFEYDEGVPFDSGLSDFEHTDTMGDLISSVLVRGHDCMWAGTCTEDKERPNPLDRLQDTSPCGESAAKGAAPSPRVSVQARTPSSVKCNQRSLLRTNRNLAHPASVASSDPLRTASQDESDDSGRPETPQSLSSSDSECTDLKHSDPISFMEEEDEDDDDVDEDDEETEVEDEEDEKEDEYAPGKAMPVSDVTGQTVRTSLHQQQHASRAHASRFDSRPQPVVAAVNHLFNDHSYHLSKDVSATIPGNLTPSDSEDEIDVVSVCGEKSAGSRSSSQCALPSNPSARDRHALQQTMASAMKRSAYQACPSYVPGRQPSGKLARMHAERQRKRRAQERDDSSEEDVVRPSKKRAKAHHHAYKPARRGHAAHAHHYRSTSSDSEPDSCEKRSLHNNMERQRRVDLRNAFEDLRVEVPVLSTNARAAKVVILKEASHYCHQLTADSKCLQQEVAMLHHQHKDLAARLSYLRKHMALLRGM